jgi:WD40 repeat protein
VKKVLEPAAGRLIGAAFSPENPARHLAFITGGADAAVVIMEWQTDRVLGRVHVGSEINRLLFSPQDSNQFSVSGPHVLKLPKLRDSKVSQGAKALPSFAGIDESAVTISDHAWIEPGDGCLVACTQEGPVYILSSQEMRVINTLEVPFQDAQGISVAVPYSIRCFSQGFVIGGSEGTIAVWERVDSGPSAHPGQKQGATTKEFRHVRTVRVKQTDSSICCLDMPATEESLIMGFRNNDIGHVSMASLYISRPGDMECMTFSGGFHNGPITGLDMAAQRPLIVSACRKDSSLRIWNYATRQCDLRWEFAGDPPNSVAIHPFGYFIAASFNDKMRIFQVLVSELKLHRELHLPRIRMLRFSNGGHLLVAAQGKHVHVFSVRTFTKVQQLSGHMQPVKAFAFDPEDNVLLTCGDDGTICEWSTSTWEQKSTYKADGMQYHAVSCNPSGDTFCNGVEGAHCFLQRFKHCDEPEPRHCKLESKFEIPNGVRLQTLCHGIGGLDAFNTHAMFAGTSTGQLWIWPSLGQGSDSGSRYQEFGLHVGSCNFVCLSSDSRTLATAGDDGAIFVLGVSGLVAGDEDRVEADVKVAESEVVLMNRMEIQQQQDEFQLLQAEHAMLKSKLEGEKIKLETECEMRVNEARQRDQAEIHELTRRCDSLRSATSAKEKESQSIRQQMKNSHDEGKLQLERLYDMKLEHESERLIALKVEQLRLEGVIKEMRKQTDIQLEEERLRAEEELERQLVQKELEIHKHKDLIAFSQHRLEKLLQEEGRVHDQDIAEMKVRSHEEVEEFRRVEVQLRREQETLWAGLNEMENERDAVEREQHEAELQISNLKGTAEELHRTVKSLGIEKKDRETTLEDKNAKIETYKAKVKDLKKFRHILNKDLKEVAESLQPKDRMIKQLQNHLHEFELEFETQLKDQRGKEDMIRQKKQQINFLKSEVQQLQTKIAEKDRTIVRYTNDLHNLVTNPEVLRKDWPAEIRRIYHVHVCGLNVREDTLPLEELQRQMRQMEGKVTTLTVKGSQMEGTCKKDIQRKAQENATLVQELNQLRVQNKATQTKVKTLELQLKNLEQGGGEAHQQLASIENTMGDLEVPLPPVPAATGMPKTPSGGALPGPRQRAQSPLEDVLPLTGKPKKGGKMVGGRQIEHEERLQNLQATADINGRQLQLQQEENKRLRKRMGNLLKGEDSNAGMADEDLADLGNPSWTDEIQE